VVAGVEGDADLALAGGVDPGECMIHRVVVRQLEQVLDLRQDLVLAVVRVGVSADPVEARS
jgi:hypothetical protein